MSDDDVYFYMQERKKQQEAMQQQDNHRDYDHLDRAVEKGMGNAESVQQRTTEHTTRPLSRLGPSTPGPAYVGSSGNGNSVHGIVFPWSHDVISIAPRRHETKNGVHQMRNIKSMKLSVDFGAKHEHLNSSKGFSVDFKNVAPHKHQINENKIKNLKIGSTLSNLDNVAGKHHKKMENFTKKYSLENGLRNESNKDHDRINTLNKKLTNYVTKRKGNVALTGANKLDFSVVGIVKNPVTKKKRGLLL